MKTAKINKINKIPKRITIKRTGFIFLEMRKRHSHCYVNYFGLQHKCTVNQWAMLEMLACTKEDEYVKVAVAGIRRQRRIEPKSHSPLLGQRNVAKLASCWLSRRR